MLSDSLMWATNKIIGGLKLAAKPGLFVLHLLSRIFWSGLNGRSILNFVLKFWINFSPVFIWLMIFKNAGVIPTKIRPRIHVLLAMNLDEAFFNIIEKTLSALVCLSVLMVLGQGLYSLYVTQASNDDVIQKHEDLETASCSSRDCLTVSASGESFDDGNDYELSDVSDESASSIPSNDQDFQQETKLSDLEFLSNITPSHLSSINKRIANHVASSGSYRPLNCWYLSPPILMGTCWFLLNIAYMMTGSIKGWKDILAWISYVLGHFFVPLFTAIWLYIFQAPGVLKLYSFGLGFQNIAGVLTHLLLPTAPPWFIHLDDKNKKATYEFPGYAAGLTRVDIAMGTHITTNGFSKSPIVFGAVPSLHSAMAVMTFFFVSYYSRWTFLKVLSFSFVMLQWWATMYLDHHWRFDLIVGLFYSTISYTLIYKWKKGVRCVDKAFISARLHHDFKHGSTMGMRTFRNTRIQDFFDPFA